MKNKNGDPYIDLFDDALIGIFHSTLEGKFLYVNKAFSNILKYDSPEDIILSVKNIETQLYVNNKRLALLDQIRRKGKLSNYEMQYYCKDGSIITALLNMHIKIDEMGNETYVEGFISDITKERNNKDALQYQKSSFECLFNNSSDAIVQFDEDENIVDANYEFLKLFGYAYEEIKGKYLNDIIDPFKQLDSYLTYAGLTKGDCQFRDTVRYDKHGYPIRLFVKGVPIVINNKTVGGYAIYTDMRAMKEAEEQIKKQQKILESHFKYSPDAVVQLDLDCNIQEINKKFIDLFGYTTNEALGKNIDDLITDQEHLKESQLIYNLALKNKKVEKDAIRRKKDGTLVDVCIRGGPIFVDGKIIGYHAIYTDISARKEAEERIKYLSYHDNLTGLYNRAFFEEELKRLDTGRQLPLSVMIGDVNGLKLTNDVFGHLEGDQLLIRIAEILKKACRKDDIICRWGGDEFAILLAKTDDKIAQTIYQRIYRLCKQSDTTPINISISLGYAVKYNSEQSMTNVIKEAEAQMYRNKLLESKSARSHIIHSLQKFLLGQSCKTKEDADRLKELTLELGRQLNLDKDKLTT